VEPRGEYNAIAPIRVMAFLFADFQLPIVNVTVQASIQNRQS
jgi:hypothetical protein